MLNHKSRLTSKFFSVIEVTEVSQEILTRSHSRHCSAVANHTFHKFYVQ